MRRSWRNPLLALLGAAAVAGIAIGFTVGGSGGSTATASNQRAGSSSVAGTQTGTTTSTGATTTTATPAIPLPKHIPQPTPLEHKLLVGTADDALKQASPQTSADLMKIAHDAGFDAVLVSSTWKPGISSPSKAEQAALGNVVHAADAQGMRVFVFVWHGLSGATPRTPQAQKQFASYAAAIARKFPPIRDVVVGNEPNLNTFWMPQFGPGGTDAAANGYLALLAQTYDALKAVSHNIHVIGGGLAPRGSDRPRLKRDTHSPSRFILDLGVAYRASGRTKPIMDAFAMHPYMRSSKLPPTDRHATSSTITIGDYAKLAYLLKVAFHGTHQRGGGLPIYYTEFGVQTKVPAAHRHAYTDLSSPAGLDAVDPATQARYYREALTLAACQPTVKGLFVFHVFDEPDLAGWQSGLYYADAKPKPSLGAFRAAAAEAMAERLTRCG